MGKQVLRSRATTTATQAKQKQTSGLNWVVKTGILKQKDKEETLRTPTSIPSTQQESCTMSRSVTQELPKSLNRMLNSTQVRSNLNDHECPSTTNYEGNRKVKRNATFSIKKFPSTPFKHKLGSTFKEGALNTSRNFQSATPKSQTKLSASAFPEALKDETDPVEHELMLLKGQLQQAVSTVNNALAQYKRWKLGNIDSDSSCGEGLSPKTVNTTSRRFN